MISKDSADGEKERLNEEQQKDCETTECDDKSSCTSKMGKGLTSCWEGTTDWLRGPWGARIRILVMDIGLYCGDTFSDIYSGYSHISLCNYYWAFFTFLCIVLPTFPSLFKLAFKLDGKMRQKFGWRKEKLAGGVLWVSVFLVNAVFAWGYGFFALTSLGTSWEYSLVYSLTLGVPLFIYHIYRSLRAMLYLLIYPPVQDGIITHPEARKAPRKRFQESFLESSPQCFLQVYVLLRDGYKGIFQPVGIILSFISIVKSISESILFFGTNQQKIPGLKAYISGSLPIIADTFFRILAWSIILNYGPLTGLIVFLILLLVYSITAASSSEGINKSMGFTTFTSFFCPSLYLAEQTDEIWWYRKKARSFYMKNKVITDTILMMVITILFGVAFSAGGEGYQHGAFLSIPPNHDNMTGNNIKCSTCSAPTQRNSTCIQYCEDFQLSFGNGESIFGEEIIGTLLNKTYDFILSECTQLCPEQIQNEEEENCNHFLSNPIYLPPATFIKILVP